MFKTKTGHQNRNALQNIANKLYQPEKLVANSSEPLPAEVLHTLAYLNTFHDLSDLDHKTLYHFFQEKSFNNSWIRKVVREKCISFSLLVAMEQYGSWTKLEESIYSRYTSKKNLEVQIISHESFEDELLIQDLLMVEEANRPAFEEAYMNRYARLLEIQTMKSPELKEIFAGQQQQSQLEFQQEGYFMEEFEEQESNTSEENGSSDWSQIPKEIFDDLNDLESTFDQFEGEVHPIVDETSTTLTTFTDDNNSVYGFSANPWNTNNTNMGDNFVF